MVKINYGWPQKFKVYNYKKMVGIHTIKRLFMIGIIKTHVPSILDKQYQTLIST